MASDLQFGRLRASVRVARSRRSGPHRSGGGPRSSRTGLCQFVALIGGEPHAIAAGPYREAQRCPDHGFGNTTPSVVGNHIDFVHIGHRSPVGPADVHTPEPPGRFVLHAGPEDEGPRFSHEGQWPARSGCQPIGSTRSDGVEQLLDHHHIADPQLMHGDTHRPILASPANRVGRSVGRVGAGRIWSIGVVARRIPWTE